jgi:integrase
MPIKRIRTKPADVALYAALADRRDAKDEPTLRAMHAALGPTTIALYEKRVAVFLRFAESAGEDPYGGEAIVARFFDGLRGAAERTITGYRHAVALAYAAHGLPDPTRGEVSGRLIEEMRREGRASTRRHGPILADQYLAMCAAQRDDRVGRRNRALFALGFEAALGNGAAYRLDREDVVIDERGMQVRVDGGKRIVAVGRRAPGDGVEAVEAWIADAGITSGPLLRNIDRNGGVGGRLSRTSIAVIPKREFAAVVGVDDADVSFESLRMGHVIEAMRRGVPQLSIARYIGFSHPRALAPYRKIARQFPKIARPA